MKRLRPAARRYLLACIDRRWPIPGLADFVRGCGYLVLPAGARFDIVMPRSGVRVVRGCRS